MSLAQGNGNGNGNHCCFSLELQKNSVMLVSRQKNGCLAPLPFHTPLLSATTYIAIHSFVGCPQHLGTCGSSFLLAIAMNLCWLTL
jgi:hypothetical protein